jgi:Gpi18-like mannosyltransferase
VPFFLPRMHERYFYLADVISLLYAFYNPRRWYLPVLIILASTLSYMPYLSSQVSFLASVNIDLRIPSAMMALAGVIVGIDTITTQRQKGIENVGIL